MKLRCSENTNCYCASWSIKRFESSGHQIEKDKHTIWSSFVIPCMPFEKVWNAKSNCAEKHQDNFGVRGEAKKKALWCQQSMWNLVSWPEDLNWTMLLIKSSTKIDALWLCLVDTHQTHQTRERVSFWNVIHQIIFQTDIQKFHWRLILDCLSLFKNNMSYHSISLNL